MRNMQRGASYIPLIIVIVLLLVAVLWAWMNKDEADQMKKDLVDAQKAAKVAVAERAELVEFIKGQVAKKSGFNFKQGDPNWDKLRIDVAGMDNALAAAYQKIQREWKIEFPKQFFFKEGTKEPYVFNDKFLGPDAEKPFKFDLENGGMASDLEGSIEVKYLEPGKIPIRDRMDLQKLVAHQADAFMRAKVDIEALVKQMAADREGYLDADAKAKEREQSLKDMNEAKQREYDDLLSTSRTQAKGLETEIENLRNDKTRLQADVDKASKAAVKLEAAMQSQIDTKEQEVVKLKRRKFDVEYPIGPDGSVLAAASGRGLVVIDRGKKDHMIPGLVFKVYTFGKGARRIDLGVIKVLEVSDHTSTARVEALRSDLRPIVEGAKFESLTYNPEEVMHFRLIGRFRKYGRSDAERRLSDLGAMVDTAVTIDTDFLVLGTPEQEEDNLRETDDYKRAVELGIKVITEEHLAQFLMY